MVSSLAFEARRKGWHMASGVFVTPMVVFTNLEYVTIVAASAFVFILVAETLSVAWNIHLPFWADRLARTKREHERFSVASLAFLAIVVLLLWLTPLPIAFAAAAQLALGDGMSALVGRAVGRIPIPYNRRKTVEGSIAGFLAGALGALLILEWYFRTAGVDYAWGSVVAVCVIGAFFASAAETIPGVQDNVTVPLSAGVSMMIAWWLAGLTPVWGELVTRLA